MSKFYYIVMITPEHLFNFRNAQEQTAMFVETLKYSKANFNIFVTW